MKKAIFANRNTLYKYTRLGTNEVYIFGGYIMGVDIKNTQATDFQNSCYASIKETAEKADAEKDTTAKAYADAMDQYNIFKDAKNLAYKKLQQAQSGNDQYAIKDAKSNYMSALSSYSVADMTADNLNSRLLDNIFSAGKFGNEACIAKCIFNF